MVSSRRSQPLTSLARAYRHQIATGSGDDTIRIWDMRSLKAIYTIPAHSSSISDVKFYRASTSPGFSYPLTLGTDTAAAEKAAAQAFLTGGAGKAVEEAERKKLENGDVGKEEVPVPLSGMYLASAGYDGYVRVWSADDWQLVKSLSMGKNDRVMSVDVSRGK